MSKKVCFKVFDDIMSMDDETISFAVQCMVEGELLSAGPFRGETFDASVVADRKGVSEFAFVECESLVFILY